MKIEILGTGCARCKKLFEVMSQSVREAGVAAEVSKVEDIVEIMKFNVMQLPAVAVDGKVVLAGRIPTPDEAKGLLQEAVHGR
jgi:small redox-active disulfide protein 2